MQNKLTQEELETIHSHYRKKAEIETLLGNLEIQKALLKGKKRALTEQYYILLQEEENLGKDLQQRYGEGSIDIETGEFVSNN